MESSIDNKREGAVLGIPALSSLNQEEHSNESRQLCQQRGKGERWHCQEVVEDEKEDKAVEEKEAVR